MITVKMKGIFWRKIKALIMIKYRTIFISEIFLIFSPDFLLVMKIIFEYPMILRDYLTNLCEFYIEYVHLTE